MFCSDCGKEVLGNFCANCGSPINAAPIENQALSIEERSIITRNGKSVNLYEQYLITGKNRLGLSSFLVSTFKLPYREANAITDDFLEMIENLPALTFGQKLKNQLNIGARKTIDTQHDEKDRVAEMDEKGIVYCPKCHSTSLSSDKKGFGIGKAVIGTALATNPLGLIAGNIGAKKVRITCLKCGHQWMAGK